METSCTVARVGRHFTELYCSVPPSLINFFHVHPCQRHAGHCEQEGLYFSVVNLSFNLVCFKVVPHSPVTLYGYNIERGCVELLCWDGC